MAVIRSFCAYRPRPDIADRVAALPYDVYSRSEAETEVKREPLSFLRVDRAETSFGPEVDTYDPRVYAKAGELLSGMIEDGIYIREDKPVYYIYELIMDGRHQTGLVACASIDDYMNGVIKKHENTREDKEQDRIRHVMACRAQTGPIFLAYRKQAVISEITARVKQGEPLYAFTAPDGVTHNVWIIDADEDISKIREAFDRVNDIYIADGHHRAASAVKAGLAMRAQNPNYTGDEEFNYFLSVLFPDDELMIMPYNRVVKDLAGMSDEEFMDRLKSVCDIEVSDTAVSPAVKGEAGMYLGGSWYRLRFRNFANAGSGEASVKSADCGEAGQKSICQSDGTDAVSRLDVSVLQTRVLAPILGIEDPRTDGRIMFVGGIRGTGELERLVDSGMAVAFSMYPTSIGELFDVADAGLLMPPKSTWFEPKLRSGLFIHTLR